MVYALSAPAWRVVDSRFFWLVAVFGLVVDSGDGLMPAPKGNTSTWSSTPLPVLLSCPWWRFVGCLNNE